MINTLFFAFWFFLPAGLANAAPVFANKIPVLNQWKTPLDFGTTLNGKRMLGANKTWRGFIFGVLIAVATFLLQQNAYTNSVWLQGAIPLNYSELSVWLGILLGSGALMGDAVESAIKRQKNIPAGDAWFPFDQTDYIIGGLLFSSLMIRLTALEVILVFMLWFGLHLLSSYVGFLLDLKQKPI